MSETSLKKTQIKDVGDNKPKISGADRHYSDGDIADVYIAQAHAYSDEHKWEKAITACQEALKLTPENEHAYKVLGTLYQKTGKVVDAMGMFAKALALQPHFPAIH